MDSERAMGAHFTAFQLASNDFKFSSGKSSGYSLRAPRLSTRCVHKVGFTTQGAGAGSFPM